jgi:hypothetical protein
VKSNLKQIGYGDVASFFFNSNIGGGGGVPTGSIRHIGLLYLPRVIMKMENLVE